MAFKYLTIWQSDIFQLFKYQTSLVFRSPLYVYDNWKGYNHLNTGLVPYSNGYCIN